MEEKGSLMAEIWIRGRKPKEKLMSKETDQGKPRESNSAYDV
jgi:hypothetical protein